MYVISHACKGYVALRVSCEKYRVSQQVEHGFVVGAGVCDVLVVHTRNTSTAI